MRNAIRAMAMIAVLTLSATLRAGDATPQKSFDEILNRKIDVDYWRVYLSEILDTLGARTGLKSAYPATLDSNFSFTFQEKGITIKALLEKLAATAHDEVEFRDGRVFFWQHADDKTFSDLEQKTRDADRWVRCDAVYALGKLADKRIYPVLFSLLKDSNPAVVSWTLYALAAHEDVLPFVENSNKDTAVQAAQKCLGLPDEAKLKIFDGTATPLMQLIGSMSTPRSTELLLPLLNSSNATVRMIATNALACSKNPAALNALLAQAETPKGIGDHALLRALERSNDSRAVAAIIRWASADTATANAAIVEAQKNSARMWGGYSGVGRQTLDQGLQWKAAAWSALSRMSDLTAQDAVAKLIQDHSQFASLAKFTYSLSARDATVSDALAADLSDADDAVRKTAALSLANAGEFRALNAVLQLVNGKDGIDTEALNALASIRDSRAEEELLKLCKNPPAEPANLDQMQRMMRRYRQPNWLGLTVQTRNPNAAEALFDDMTDTKADLSTRARMAAALTGSLVERSQLEKLNDYLLNSAEVPFLQILLTRGALRPGFTYGYSYTTFRGASDYSLFSDARWVDKLVQLSQQPFPRSAKQLSMSTGAMAYAQDGDGVRELVKGNPAIEVLTCIPSPAAVRARIAAMSSADAEIRETAVLSMFSEPGRSDPANIEALAALLNDKVEAIQMQAVEVLARLGDKRVVPALKAVIARKPPGGNDRWAAQQHRWSAAASLLKLNDSEAKEIILALAKDPDSSASDSDVRYLGDASDPAVQEILRAVMSDKAVASDRREQAALSLFQNSADPEALGALFDILKTPMRDGIVNGVHLGATDHNSRVRILNALQTSSDPKINDGLLAMIGDNAVPLQLRSFVVENLRAVAMTDDARSKCGALMKDEKTPVEVRARIASMLCGFCGHWGGLQKTEKPEPEALATLLKLYKDKALNAETNMLGQSTLSIACDVLAQSGDADARQTLMEGMKSGDAKTKALSAGALTQFCRDEAAIDCLLAIIKGGGAQKDRQMAHYQLQSVSQDPKVAEAVKQKIKTSFDEMNKPQKPPSPPAQSDF